MLEGVNYVSLTWNAGAPNFITSASETSFNCLETCLAYVVVRKGTTLHWIDAREQNVDGNRKARRLFLQFSRFIHLGAGSVLSNAGTLHIAVTAGKFNFMLEELTHSAFNTLTAGTATANVFKRMYRDGVGGWTEVADQKVVDTTLYDSGTGTLTALPNSKYGVTWFYMIMNNPNHIVGLPGHTSYANQSEAESATPPTTVPPIVEGLGVLVGFATYYKADAEFTSVLSAFTTSLSASGATLHNALAGLQGGAAGDYQHLTTAQVNSIASATVSLGTGDMLFQSRVDVFLAPYNLSTLYQDDAATTPAAVLDTIGAVLNTSWDVGESADFTQATASLRPQLVEPTTGVYALDFDTVDDIISYTFASPLVGTMIVGTTAGTYALEVSIPAGAYNFGRYEKFPIVGVMVAGYTMSERERIAAMSILTSKGAGPYLGAFTGETSFYVGASKGVFASRTDILTLHAEDWDMSSMTTIRSAFLDCPGLVTAEVSSWDLSSCTLFTGVFNGNSALTTLDVSAWDTSLGTSLVDMFKLCTSLATIDVSGWNVANVTNITSMFYGCSSLTSLDISGWSLTSLTTATNFIGQSTSLATLTVGTAFDNTPCTNYASAFTGCALNQASVDAILVSINNAGTSSGTLGMSSGTNATPSATGQAATDALRGRGWTVTLNGY
jgi:surface protein